jgi:nucleotide-binding universal stress UspA family protein
MADTRWFLVPYDFSEHANAALDAAVDFARRLDANLHLLHVIQLPAYAYAHPGIGGAYVSPSPVDARIREGVESSLRNVVDGLRDFPGKISTEIAEGSNIAEMITGAATKLRADLVIMGTHGRTGLAHVFLGSVAERTLRQAPCPVLTVRSDENRETD